MLSSFYTLETNCLFKYVLRRTTNPTATFDAGDSALQSTPRRQPALSSKFRVRISDVAYPPPRRGDAVKSFRYFRHLDFVKYISASRGSHILVQWWIDPRFGDASAHASDTWICRWDYSITS